MLKSVVFDFNGLLVNDLELHEEAYLRAAADLGFSLSEATVRQYVSCTPNEKRVFYFGDITDETWENISHRKKEYYFRLAEQRELLYPDVEEVVMQLAETYPLGVISNTTREYFERSFPEVLAGLFKETLFADEVENPKPSPEPLLKILQALGVEPEESCYVGDSLLDVKMAKAAGVRIFSVTTGYETRDELTKAGADAVFENLSAFAIHIGNCSNEAAP
jgi:HAD superfamily hydrolase (TIGR01549 family)